MALLLIAYLLKYRQRKEKSQVLVQKSFLLRCWSVCIVENKAGKLTPSCPNTSGNLNSYQAMIE